MFMILIPTLLIILNVYVFIRFKSYINTFIKGKKSTLLYCLIWLVIIALIVYSAIKGYLFGLAFSIYTAVFLYLFLIILAVDVIRIFIRKIDKKKWAVFIFVFTSCILAYGFVNTYIIDVKEYNVVSSKNIQPLKIVQISDTHYGSTQGVQKAKQMVEKINKQNPDIVLCTGDIFDGNYEWVDKPDEIAEVLKSINSKYGTYACWGNHDEYGGLSNEMYSFLDKADITLLEDDSALIDDSFYVVGRIDSPSSIESLSYSAGKTIDELTENLDKSKYIITLDHRPKELDIDADAGVDLILSGHTHNGQTFPFNMIIGCFWDNPYGMKQYDNMTSIVTSGVGLWGPPIRVGTDSEIVVINVK